MAKLYWRVKRDRKWTWVAATDVNTQFYEDDKINDFHYFDKESYRPVCPNPCECEEEEE